MMPNTQEDWTLSCLTILLLHVGIVVVGYSTESLDFIRNFDDGQIMFFLYKTFHIFYEDILYVSQYINEYLGNIYNIYD